ncbi:HAD family hydrolase [Sulfurospirillum barnesii]|uniref:phosphoglycolate phosphatase n=1 Tax=Sulfurospirillum barnesii (strain ATCC 700032 / DSM 10660 / SES-3) TaxID=760154 RepID=I3XZF2_SULBS|nr:HAD family hydrolase [Sulfurospirillum barnesii]AFL69326.1 haloacid dehalogenase superfamily enzyme, subfamily IA [Sulfurospirillum barnesii SES-3]
MKIRALHVKINMKKVIVFDLDGTLLDTLEDIAISANFALKSLGFQAEEHDKYRYFVGEGVFKLFENIFASNPQEKETIQKAVGLFESHYTKQFHQNTTLYEGVSKMLTFLHARGFKMAILSNKPDSFTKMCAVKYLRQWDFEVVFGVREGVPRKPDPSAALEICELLHVKPEACYYLGDTMIDMQTANRAGMIALGALWGFRDEAELREHGAKYLLKTPSEVIKLLTEV